MRACMCALARACPRTCEHARATLYMNWSSTNGQEPKVLPSPANFPSVPGDRAVRSGPQAGRPGRHGYQGSPVTVVSVLQC